MIVLIVVLIAFILILSYTTYNLLRKNEKLEDIVNEQTEILAGYMTYLNKVSDIISHSNKRLKEVDSKGSFESDDEVGFFFEQLKSIQSVLDQFNIKNI
jgi:Tfp pilus assembly protein PilO